ncbi:hypothetical protein CRUP_032257 [Coryphaenoides rupestris]|nr:hypothetical protein CRUP_032257 [Coryphaenoides rupestris]
MSPRSSPELSIRTHSGSDLDPRSLSSRLVQDTVSSTLDTQLVQDTVSSTLDTQSAIWGHTHTFSLQIRDTFSLQIRDTFSLQIRGRFSLQIRGTFSLQIRDTFSLQIRGRFSLQIRGHFSLQIRDTFSLQIRHIQPPDQRHIQPPDQRTIQPPDQTHSASRSEAHSASRSDTFSLQIRDTFSLQIRDTFSLQDQETHSASRSDTFSLQIRGTFSLQIRDTFSLQIRDTFSLQIRIPGLKPGGSRMELPGTPGLKPGGSRMGPPGRPATSGGVTAKPAARGHQVDEGVTPVQLLSVKSLSLASIFFCSQLKDGLTQPVTMVICQNLQTVFIDAHTIQEGPDVLLGDIPILGREELDHGPACSPALCIPQNTHSFHPQTPEHLPHLQLRGGEGEVLQENKELIRTGKKASTRHYTCSCSCGLHMEAQGGEGVEGVEEHGVGRPQSQSRGQTSRGRQGGQQGHLGALNGATRTHHPQTGVFICGKHDEGFAMLPTYNVDAAVRDGEAREEVSDVHGSSHYGQTL